MRVFIAPVSSEKQYVKSIQSLYHVVTRPGDSAVDEFLQYTGRGDVQRSYLCDLFLKSDYDAIWMVDADMEFHPNVLERLRSHDKDIVCGNYFRRDSDHMVSIITLDGNQPLYDIPDFGLWDQPQGRDIVNCGFGNVLIRKEVIINSSPPGELPFSLGPLPESTNGEYGKRGADYKFFAHARDAGFKICLDAHPWAEAKHATTFWLDRDLYNQLRRPPETWITN